MAAGLVPGQMFWDVVISRILATSVNRPLPPAVHGVQDMDISLKELPFSRGMIHH